MRRPHARGRNDDIVFTRHLQLRLCGLSSGDLEPELQMSGEFDGVSRREQPAAGKPFTESTCGGTWSEIETPSRYWAWGPAPAFVSSSGSSRSTNPRYWAVPGESYHVP